MLQLIVKYFDVFIEYILLNFIFVTELMEVTKTSRF